MKQSIYRIVLLCLFLFLIFVIPAKAEKPQFDFEKGITFESEAEGEAIVGSTGKDTDRFKYQWGESMLTLSRVEFDGSYAMKGITGCEFPEAFIELGKTYPKGTTFTFRYYVKADVGEEDTYKMTLRGYPGGEKEATGYAITGRKFGQWHESTITFKEAHDRVAIFMEFKKPAIGDGKCVELYYDDLYINKKVTSTIKVFDFEKGITFENAEQAEAIVGSTGQNTDRFGGQWTQSALSLSRVGFDGSYTMKGKTNCQFPEAFVELGKAYPKGTTFTFRYYVEGQVNDTETYKVVVVGYPGGAKATTGYETVGHKFNQWNTLTITFKEAHDRLALRVELGGTSAIKDGKFAQIYLDDLYINKVSASAPAQQQQAQVQEQEPSVNVPFDFEKGITFEDANEATAIMGSTGKPTSRFPAGWEQEAFQISREYFGSSYTMMGTTKNQFPAIRVELGKNYPKGTTLNFQVYVEGIADAGATIKTGLRGYSEGSVSSVGYIDPKLQFNVWNEMTYTFRTAHDRFEFFIEIGGTNALAEGRSVRIYYDNFSIQLEQDEPKEKDDIDADSKVENDTTGVSQNDGTMTEDKGIDPIFVALIAVGAGIAVCVITIVIWLILKYRQKKQEIKEELTT